MMIKRHLPLSIFLIAGILLTSCAASKKFTEISKLGIKKNFWLLGSWNQNKSNTVEEWKFINKNLITGRMYSAVKGDTIIAETYKLERKGKEVFFTMKSTESTIPQVEMKLKSETPGVLIFENPQQEFPRTISIKLDGTSKTTLFEGINKDGEGVTRDFYFTKSEPAVKK